MSVLRLLCVVAAAICTGCGPGAFLNGEGRALARLDPAAAATEAKAAIAEGDDRLIGVFGYSLEVPGIETPGRLWDQSKLRMLDGTSDAPRDMKINDRAVRYAEIYNRTVLAQRGNAPMLRALRP